MTWNFAVGGSRLRLAATSRLARSSRPARPILAERSITNTTDLPTAGTPKNVVAAPGGSSTAGRAGAGCGGPSMIGAAGRVGTDGQGDTSMCPTGWTPLGSGGGGTGTDNGCGSGGAAWTTGSGLGDGAGTSSAM